MPKAVDSSHKEFSEKLRALEQRTEKLSHAVENAQTEHSELLSQVLLDLQVSLEELRVAEEEMRQQNEELIIARQTIETEHRRYRDLFEFAPDGYLVTDTAGMIQEANRAAAALLGVSQRALSGKPLVIYLAREHHAAFYALLRQLSQGEGTHMWEAALQPRNGKFVPLSVSVAQLQDPHGSVCGFRWLLRDITEQVEAKERLRVLNASLEVRIQRRTAELQRSNDELQQFA